MRQSAVGTQNTEHSIWRHHFPNPCLITSLLPTTLEWGGDPQNPPKIHREVCGFGGSRRSFWPLGARNSILGGPWPGGWCPGQGAGGAWPGPRRQP
eukprot:gene19192-biopygen19030